jgi:hypothetical protein
LQSRAARFVDSDRMRTENHNGFFRRGGLWAWAVFALLFPLSGRASAAPAHVQAASHFTIADFDGDNRPDLASVHIGQSGFRNTRYWIAFQLSGRSGPTVSVMGPAGGLRITARDVNGDKFPDVVITTVWTNKPVAILLNDGLGNFKSANPSEFQAAFAASETSCGPAVDEIRDATALLYSRPVPGECREERASFSRSSVSDLSLLFSSPGSVSRAVSLFAGRAPPSL